MKAIQWLANCWVISHQPAQAWMISLTGLTAWAISLWSPDVSTAKCAASHL